MSFTTRWYRKTQSVTLFVKCVLLSNSLSSVGILHHLIIRGTRLLFLHRVSPIPWTGSSVSITCRLHLKLGFGTSRIQVWFLVYGDGDCLSRDLFILMKTTSLHPPGTTSVRLWWHMRRMRFRYSWGEVGQRKRSSFIRWTSLKNSSSSPGSP